MKSFQITVRSAGHCTRYTALAASSSAAWSDAAEMFGDEPCGITVTSQGQGHDTNGKKGRL